MVFPYVNYVFIPVLFLFFLHAILLHRKRLNFAEILRFNKYLVIISIFFVWGFINSSSFSILALKELLNIAIVLFISTSLLIFIRNRESFDRFTETFCKQFIFFASLASVLGLIKSVLHIKGFSLLSSILIDVVDGTSLTSDNNFYILFSFIGLFSIVYGLIRFNWKSSFPNNTIFALLLFIISLNVVFSYSRRGFILLILFYISVIVLYIILSKKRVSCHQVLSGYILSFTLAIFLIVGFIFGVPTHYKRKVLEWAGISVNNYKYFSFSLVYKYGTIFSNQNKEYFQRAVWVDYPNPIDPDSGWGTGVKSLVFPLTGENVEIVPKNAIGYKLDKLCDFSSWNNNAYYYTNIQCLYRGKPIVSHDGYYSASVYCFVSSDFNGNWVRISAEGKIDGRKIQEYDLIKKGRWQRLQIEFKCDSGVPPVFLFWSKYGVTNFKDLKGYIVFAYPQYFSTSKSIDLRLTRSAESEMIQGFTKASLILLPGVKTFFSGIRSSLTSDTLIKPDQDKIIRDLVQNNFSGARTSRWLYSWMIFKEYPAQKKLLGGGFDYLELFGTKFKEGKYDYPHNPFISAFLYSGILGGLAYIWFICLVFYYYFKYFKYHIFYFVCFLAVSYFSFVSANTHFSVPVFAVLCIIPFLTKFITDKESPGQSEN